MRRESWSFVARIVLALGALVCSPFAAALPTFIDGAGHEWRQVTETAGLSYNSLAAVCATDGATGCSGSATPGGGGGPIDLTGWIWATQSQVGTLFQALSGGVFPGGAATTNGVDSTWAPAIVGTIFDPTFNNGGLGLIGLTATPGPLNGFGVLGYVFDASSGDDTMSTLFTAPANFRSPDYGAFMFRSQSAAVPAPATLLLVGLALVPLLGRTRRRSLAA